MSTKFDTGVRFNTNMGLLEALSFFGEGVGAALYLLGAFTALLALDILGIVFMLGAVLVLRAHLGQPTRGWRALSRLGCAWVSRGTLLIGGFTGCATLSVVVAYVGALQPLRSGLTLAAVAFSVPVLLYAGLLLRSMRAVRFWRGITMPLAFSAHSAATALTLACALVMWLPGGGAPIAIEWLQPGAIIALLLAAAMSAAQLLLVEPSVGTQASVNRLLTGSLRGLFLGRAGILGLLVPLAALLGLGLLARGEAGPQSTFLLAGLALLRLYGDFAYRYAIVQAGAYEPIFPAMPTRSFPNRRGKALA